MKEPEYKIKITVTGTSVVKPSYYPKVDGKPMNKEQILKHEKENNTDPWTAMECMKDFTTTYEIIE